MRAKASPARTPAREPAVCARRRARCATNAALLARRVASSMPIVERHWLRCASSASTLRSRYPSTRSTWSTRLRLEQQQRARAVRRQTLLGEEVRVARGDDAVDGEQSGVRGDRDGGGTAATGRGRARRRAAPARITAHDRGPRRRDRSSSSPSTQPRKRDVDRAEHRGRVALLVLAARDERCEVGVGVPGALRAVGADAQVHLGARRRPTSRAWRRSRTRCRRDARRSRARGAGTGRST